MIVWFAIIIPLIAIPVLWWKFNKKLMWWEVLILFATPIILVALSKALIEAAQVHDTEYWGGWANRAEYYEDWNERVSCRHPVYETTTDSKGNTHTRFVGYQHLYDVDYHPPYWQVIDSNGITVGVDNTLFEHLAGRFNSRVFVNLHRSYHTKNGNEYVAHWDGKPETLEPVTTTHSYENRVKASSTILKYKDVDPKIDGLFEYSKITGYYHQRSIQGNGGPTLIQAENRLDYFNATLGPKKQVRLFVLIFKDKPISVGMDQEAYWKRSNKNEFVTCIGVNSAYEVQWAYAFSWTKVEELKVEARDFLAEQKTLDLAAYVEWLGPEIDAKFVRFNWHEFDYITVDPPGWAVFLVFLITILVNAGISIWAVMNQYESDGSSSFTSHYERTWR